MAMSFWRAWQHVVVAPARPSSRTGCAPRREALLGEMPVLAAGTALFAILAAVPLLAAVVGVYGLVADPYEIHTHLRGLDAVLPPDVLAFLGDQLERQAKRSSGDLGIAVATSIAVAMFSARGAARALIAVLNRAYRVRDRRRAGPPLLLSIAMAGATLVGLMLMLGVVVALPGIVALLDLAASASSAGCAGRA